MDVIKQLGNLTKIITWLNLRRVGLLALAALIGLVMLTLYEQRARVVEAVQNRNVEVQSRPVKTNVLTVPIDMQTKIKKIVDDSQIITAVSVLNVDLKLNQRSVIFEYSDSAVITGGWERFYHEHGFTQPIFTTSDKNNSQMVAVINGEFTCVRYDDSVNAALVPETHGVEPMICRISLPPYYGEFSGYLVIGLSKTPTPAERDEIMIAAKALSNEIFLKNVVNR